MALKYKLRDQAAVDALPEAVRGEYSQAEDGSFVLGVEIGQGEAGLEDVSGLRNALKAERENVGKTKKELTALKTALGNLTPEQIAAAAARLQAGEDDAVVQAAAKLRAENDGLRVELQRAARDNAVSAAVDAARGNRALLLPWLRENAKFDDKGKVKIGATVHDNIEAALVAMRALPELQSAFAGSGNAGGGAGGGSTTGGGGTGTGDAALPSRRSRMSVAQKAAYISENGTDKFMQLPA